MERRKQEEDMRRVQWVIDLETKKEQEKARREQFDLDQQKVRIDEENSPMMDRTTRTESMISETQDERTSVY
jgi:hypothetical protein